MVNYGITILNSSVVECLLSMQKIPGSTVGYIYFLCEYCHMLQLQHLLSAVYDALLMPGLHNTFFSLVNKRLRSHWTEALLKHLSSGSVHAGA